uniref:Uncharacterized protein n=1 Tax=Anguilla anguilla TaxID=7936 RepID=A0A0E9QJU6_ANGAN
MHTSSVCD